MATNKAKKKGWDQSTEPNIVHIKGVDGKQTYYSYYEKNSVFTSRPGNRTKSSNTNLARQQTEPKNAWGINYVSNKAKEGIRSASSGPGLAIRQFYF